MPHRVLLLFPGYGDGGAVVILSGSAVSASSGSILLSIPHGPNTNTNSSSSRSEGEGNQILPGSGSIEISTGNAAEGNGTEDGEEGQSGHIVVKSGRAAQAGAVVVEVRLLMLYG